MIKRKCMQNEEQQLKNLSRVLRCARKKKNIDQVALSKLVGISQSSLSKFENQILTPSAPQWLNLAQCLEFEPTLALELGIIDFASERYSKIPVFGKKKIPSKYSERPGIKVRSILPLINYAIQKKGMAEVKQLLKSMKVDFDFFTCMDHALNNKFYIDFLSNLKAEGLVDEATPALVASYAEQEDVHGKLNELFEIKTDPIQRIKAFVKNHKKYDQIYNFEITNETNNSIDILITPTEVMSESDYLHNTEVQKYFEDYNKTYIQKFAASHSAFTRETSMKVHDSLVNNHKMTLSLSA